MRDCNQLIKSFTSIVQDPEPISDLMLYFMEEITRVASIKGRYSESYVHTLSGQFRKTLEYLNATGILEHSMPRVRKVIGLADRVSHYLAKEYEEVVAEIMV